MKKGNAAVFGIYKTRGQVEMAIESLRDAGYRVSDISVLMPKSSTSDDLAHVKETKAPEGATAGAGTGAVLGGALGWLVGAGAIALTGFAPLIAAGPIMAALAGAAAGGTVGGVTGALVGWGIPEYEAKRFEGLVREGGILLSVHADDREWAKKAKVILEQSGAADIASAGEEKDGDMHRPKIKDKKDTTVRY